MLKFKLFNLSVLGVVERFYLMMLGIIVLGFMNQFLLAAIWGFTVAISSIVGFSFKSKSEEAVRENTINIVSKEEKEDWHYQKDTAKNALSKLRGVKFVQNEIAIKSTVITNKVKSQISKAFERAAQIDANQISIDTHGHEVRLSGTVNSWSEKRDAKNAAYKVPGVWSVKNELTVVS